jgi:hypothetical protein
VALSYIDYVMTVMDNGTKTDTDGNIRQCNIMKYYAEFSWNMVNCFSRSEPSMGFDC